MTQGKHNQESQSLIDMRTHLTVATLAVAQLHRRHGEDADIDRLCGYAETAITHLKEDIATMEKMLPPRGEHVEPSPQPLRALPVAAGGQGQDTGPMVVPSPTPKVDVHGQETGAIPLPPEVERDRPR